MPDPNIADADQPGLCGCGHDEAYHYRTVYKPMDERDDKGNLTGRQVWAIAGRTGCTFCICTSNNKSQRPMAGMGDYGGKDFGDKR